MNILSEAMITNKLISQTYYDPNTGYVGAKKLHEKLKKKGVTMKEVETFLEKQEVVQINKKNVGKQGSFIPLHPKQQYQIDLIYLENTHLNNASYGLVTIDIFTKIIDVQLIKKKTAVEVSDAFKKTLDIMGTPNCIMSDEGAEFTASEFQKLLKDHHIEQLFTKTHAVFAERVNRTIKEMLSKYLQASNSKTITNVLPKIVDNYNNSYHKSIKMTPVEAAKPKNEITAWKNIQSVSTIKEYPPLSSGDFVRVPIKQKTFQKGYQPKFSKTVHKVLQKKDHYYYIDNNEKYLRAHLQKVNGDVEKPIVKPDLENTQEGRLKDMAKLPVIKTDQIEPIQLQRRSTRIRKPKTFQDFILTHGN